MCANRPGLTASFCSEFAIGFSFLAADAELAISELDPETETLNDQDHPRCLAAAAILATGAAHAQAIGDGPAETINWYVNAGFQPYFILSGPDEGKGSFDQSMKLLMKAMPQYPHKLVEASLPRMLDSIKTRAERLARGPVQEQGPRGHHGLLGAVHVPLAQRHRDHAKANGSISSVQNEHGEVRLEDFLADGKAKLALAAERSYGPVVRRRRQEAPRRDDVGFVDRHLCEPTAEAHQSKRVRRDHRDAVELQYKPRTSS